MNTSVNDNSATPISVTTYFKVKQSKVLDLVKDIMTHDTGKSPQGYTTCVGYDTITKEDVQHIKVKINYTAPDRTFWGYLFYVVVTAGVVSSNAGMYLGPQSHFRQRPGDAGVPLGQIEFIRPDSTTRSQFDALRNEFDACEDVVRED